MSSMLTWLTTDGHDVNSVDMSQKKTNYHHGDLVAHLERLAREKIRRNGSDSLSLRSCAREAGVDPSAVYRHFKSKDDLLGHLTKAAFAELAQAMQTAQAANMDRDPEEALIQIGLAYIHYAVTEPHIFQMMFDIAGRFPPEGWPKHAPEEDTSYGILVSSIERLNPTAPVEIHAFTLWSMVHGFASLKNTGLVPDAADFDFLSRALCESAVKTIT